MPASAFDTGQFSLAVSAAALNAASSIPGTVPRTVSTPFVIPSPGWNVTVADVSSFSGGLPPRARRPERDIAKQLAQAEAISSSGLVLPFGSSAREAHDTSSGPNAPLGVSAIVPLPFIRSPCQTTLALRSVAIRPSPPLAGPPAEAGPRARG